MSSPRPSRAVGLAKDPLEQITVDYRRMQQLLLELRDPVGIVYITILNESPGPINRLKLVEKTGLDIRVLARALHDLFGKGFIGRIRSGRETYYFERP